MNVKQGQVFMITLGLPCKVRFIELCQVSMVRSDLWSCHDCKSRSRAGSSF